MGERLHPPLQTAKHNELSELKHEFCGSVCVVCAFVHTKQGIPNKLTNFYAVLLYSGFYFYESSTSDYIPHSPTCLSFTLEFTAAWLQQCLQPYIGTWMFNSRPQFLEKASESMQPVAKQSAVVQICSILLTNCMYVLF